MGKFYEDVTFMKGFVGQLAYLFKRNPLCLQIIKEEVQHISWKWWIIVCFHMQPTETAHWTHQTAEDALGANWQGDSYGPIRTKETEYREDRWDERQACS